MRNKSIRIRLAVWYTAVLSLGLVLFSGTVWIALRQALHADLRTTLENQERGLGEYLKIEDQDATNLAVEIDEFSRSLPSGHLLSVQDQLGRSIYQNWQDAPKERTLAARIPPATVTLFSWHNRPYLGMKDAILLRQGEVTEFLAVSAESVNHVVRLVGLLLLATVPVFVLCAAGGGLWLSRRALEPIAEITERAQTTGVGNLSERLTVPETGDELQALTETWNQMLGRIESAVARLSQFTADASHELRTPVAIIRFAAENALRKMRSEGEYRSGLERIQAESERMTTLIADLLFLARADVGFGGRESSLMELQPVVAQACQDMQPLALAKQVKLGEAEPAAAIHVSGNASELRRVTLVLLDDAIKYTPPGGRVTVRLEEREGQAILSVEDSGIGIPEKERARVFERFFRADESRNKESGGHGLGLAIAQAIVRQHAGSIRFEAVTSGGCIFYVSIPLAAGEISARVQRESRQITSN